MSMPSELTRLTSDKSPVQIGNCSRRNRL